MRLGLAIDLDTCVGCHACAVACKEWNGESLMGGAPDYDAWGKTPAAPGTTASAISRLKATRRIRRIAVVAGGRERPATAVEDGQRANELHALRGRALRDRVPDRCQLQARGRRHRAGRSRALHGMQLLLLGLPVWRRELDQDKGVMKKCTLCVDRIYDTQLPEAERQPACVLCPATRDTSATTTTRDLESVATRC